jgi:hypothetical protein
MRDSVVRHTPQFAYLSAAWVHSVCHLGSPRTGTASLTVTVRKWPGIRSRDHEGQTNPWSAAAGERRRGEAAFVKLCSLRELAEVFFAFTRATLAQIEVSRGGATRAKVLAMSRGRS